MNLDLYYPVVVWCDTGWRTALPLLYWIVVNCCLVFLGSSLVTFIEVNILVLSRAVSSYFISLHIHLPSVRSYSVCPVLIFPIDIVEQYKHCFNNRDI